jgi:antitoxin component YwqK of YwqJK toxin-antitoxin module
MSKMKTFFTTLHVACSISAFSQNLRTVTTYHDYLQTKKNEVYTAEPNTLSKQGSYKRYDELGTLIEEATYKNNNLNGVRKIYYDASLANSHSKPTDYYGKLFAVENYVNGVLEGTSKEYQYLKGQQALLKDIVYKNGKEDKLVEYHMESSIIASYEIDNGDCYSNFKSGAKESVYKRVNGNIHGKYVKYFENGKVASEGEYNNGSKTGVWKNYFENGALKSEENDAKIGECTVSLIKEYSEQALPVKEIKLVGANQIQEIAYFENGKKKSESPFVIASDCEKIKEGVEKTYFENEVVETEITYKNGKAEGTGKGYYESGKLYTDCIFANGRKTGTVKTFFEDGKIQSTTEIESGGGAAYVKNYYNNGNLKSEGRIQILGEKPMGDWKYYKEDGKLDYVQSPNGTKTSGSDLESREVWNKIGENKGQSWKLYEELSKKCGAYCAGSDCTVDKKKDLFMAGKEIYESITKKLDSRTNPVPREEAFKMSEQMRKSLEKCVSLVDSDSKAIEKLLRKASTMDEKIQILTN